MCQIFTYLDRWSTSKSATVGIDQNEKDCHQKTHTPWHLNEKNNAHFSVNSTYFSLYKYEQIFTLRLMSDGLRSF